MRASVLAVVGLLLFTIVPAPAEAGPSDPREFTWDKPGVLARGGGGLDTSQVDWLYSQGFRAIANFRSEHADPESYIRGKGMEYLYIPVDHAVDMNATQVEKFVAWAQKMESLGKPMYVHCTNGWHRAAAFVVGYEMKTQGDSYDQAAKDVVARRPGTVMRAPAALLEYQSRLRGQENVDVLLLSPLSRPSLGGTMPAQVEVLKHGRPVAGASVRVYSEESRMNIYGTTGSDGRFSFTYRAPSSGATDHLYARASLSGYLDGADNVEMFYGTSSGKFSDTLILKAWAAGDRVGAEARRSSGSHANARFVATGGSGDHGYEISVTGRASLSVAPTDAPVEVRAVMWGAKSARVTLGSTTTDPDPTTGDVTFVSRGGSEWWVQAKVSGPDVRLVESRDTGDASWHALTLRSWGDWAGSYHVEPGHLVRFRATLGDGRVVESCEWTHPGAVEQCGTTPQPDPTTGTFDATFKNVRGNEWWVETDVSVAGGTLAGVDARVNGGSWIALSKQSYGSWAKSIHAAPGSKVEFRARASDGATDVSAAYTWPPA